MYLNFKSIFSLDRNKGVTVKNIFFYFLICFLVFSFSIRTFQLDFRILAVYVLFLVVVNLLLFNTFLFRIDKLLFLHSLFLILLLIPMIIYAGGSGFYLSRDILPILKNGYFDSDTSFHVAIAESIKNYGYPSTLLHGNPVLNYHVGSHYLLALLSFISTIPIIELFPYQNSFFPLLFITYFLIFISSKVNRGLLAILSLFVFVILNNHEKFFWTFDISTPISLFWSMLLIIRLSRKQSSDLVDYVLLALTFLCKVSVGVYLFGIYGVYRVIFFKKSILIRFARFSILLGLFMLLFYLTSDDFKRHSLHWEYGSLHKQLLDQEKRDVRIIAFFVLPSLLFFFSLVKKNWQLVTSCLGIILISYLAINLSFDNRAHLHFIVGANWITVFLFSGLRISNVRKTIYYIPLYICISIFVLFNSPFIKQKMPIVIDMKPQYPQKTNADLYIQKLIELRNRDEKFLIQIPEQETDFWNHWAHAAPSHSRYFMAFWIPMLSGKPAYNGYNSKFMKETSVGWYPPGTYGYSSYYNDSTGLKGFRKIIKLSKVEGKIVEEVIFFHH